MLTRKSSSVSIDNEDLLFYSPLVVKQIFHFPLLAGKENIKDKIFDHLGLMEHEITSTILYGCLMLIVMCIGYHVVSWHQIQHVFLQQQHMHPILNFSEILSTTLMSCGPELTTTIKGLP